MLNLLLLLIIVRIANNHISSGNKWTAAEARSLGRQKLLLLASDVVTILGVFNV